MACWIVSDFKTIYNAWSARADCYLTILEASRIKKILSLSLSCLTKIFWWILFGKGSLSLFDCLNLLLGTSRLKCSCKVVLSTFSRSASSLIKTITWIRVGISGFKNDMGLLLWRSISFFGWALLQELANLIDTRSWSFGCCRNATLLASALVYHANKLVTWQWTHLIRSNDVLVTWSCSSCSFLHGWGIFAGRGNSKLLFVGRPARFVTGTSLLVSRAAYSACGLALLSWGISSVLLISRLLRARLRHNLLIEVKDAIHTGSDGLLIDSESSHNLQLIRPNIADINDLSGSHYDSTAEGQLVVLEELVTLQAHVCVEFSVSLHTFGHFQGWLDVTTILCGNPITRKHDTLAQEVCDNIINWNNLQVPLEHLKEVLFHTDELVISEGAGGDLEQLLHSWVSLLKVFSADEHGSNCS